MTINDMRAVIVPKSDQKNADDLIAGPITITVREVSIRPGTEQPVSIHFDGDEGKPYKPCKSMSRVLVHLWGPDANKYVGRGMTLYCDPKVLWAGMAVGGIRISHMSHIDAPVSLMLTATKGSRKPFTVQPLAMQQPNAAPAEMSVDEIEALRKLAEAEAFKGESALDAFLLTLTKGQKMALKPSGAMLRALAKENTLSDAQEPS